MTFLNIYLELFCLKLKFVEYTHLQHYAFSDTEVWPKNYYFSFYPQNVLLNITFYYKLYVEFKNVYIFIELILYRELCIINHAKQ